MKKIGFLAFALSAFLTSPAFCEAPVAPHDCWAEAHAAATVDGIFSIFLDTDKYASGAALNETLGKFYWSQLRNFDRGVRFPMVSGNTLHWQVVARQNSGESRGQMIARVNDAIEQLQQLDGVRIDCEQAMIRQPVVSGSNRR